MRVTIELPEGWGPRRLVLVQMERLGYDVTEHIDMGTGTHWLTVGGRVRGKGEPSAEV
jgi:hypothetical protein